MIDQWLKAGVLEDGLLRHATEGSPQGGVVSPCLSNIFLHHVLDVLFENEVKPRLKGKSTLVRFANDAVMAFADFRDAQRVLGVLGKRLARYGLTLHPGKTRFHVRVQARVRVGYLLRKSGSEPSSTLRTGWISFKWSVERFRQIGRENVEAKEAGR